MTIFCCQFIQILYSTLMNVDLVRKWITENSPNGQAKLSAVSGVSMATITNILAGRSVNVRTAKLLARVLDITLDELCQVNEMTG